MALLLYYLFTISYFLHLTARFPALGAIRFDLMLMCLTTFFIILTKRNNFSFSTSKPSRILLYFILYTLIEIPLVAYPGSVIHYGIDNFAKVSAFFFFTVYIIDTEKKFKWLVILFLACQCIRIFEPLYLHITTGYWGDIATSHADGTFSVLDRLSSGPFDVLNSTQFGWLIVSIFIFYYYLLIKAGKKGFLLFCIIGPPTIYTFLLTGARSGLLCLFLVIILILYFREKRSSGLILAIVFLTPLIFWVASHLSPQLQTRYMSLVKKDVAGSDTAAGRFTGLMENLSTVWNSPIFGHGLGTTIEVNVHAIGSAQPSHNMYIEILQETGIIGLVLFLMFIKAMLNELHDMRRRLLTLPERPWLLNLITALIVWMYMHLFYTLSCFSLNSWEWYVFGGLAVASLRFSKSYMDEDMVKTPQVSKS